MLTPFQKEIDAKLTQAGFVGPYTDKYGVCRIRGDMSVYVAEDYVDFMEFNAVIPKVVRKFLILDSDKIELIKKLISVTRDCKTFDEFTAKYNEIKEN